jgi:hypothetical protein
VFALGLGWLGWHALLPVRAGLLNVEKFIYAMPCSEKLSRMDKDPEDVT